MIKRYSIVLFLCVALIGVGCGSSPQTAKQRTPQIAIDSGLHAPMAPVVEPKYGIAFSAGGLGDLPPDAFSMDTDHSMGFETRSRDANGVWHSLKGLAVLEPQDYATFAQIVSEGKLLDIDPADLLGTCPRGELYTLSLTSTSRKHAVHIDYSSCARDYNLLTGQQRAGFAKLNVWIDSVRRQYRPKLPEN
jgi:hypothetical protein